MAVLIPILKFNQPVHSTRRILSSLAFWFILLQVNSTFGADQNQHERSSQVSPPKVYRGYAGVLHRMGADELNAEYRKQVATSFAVCGEAIASEVIYQLQIRFQELNQLNKRRIRFQRTRPIIRNSLALAEGCAESTQKLADINFEISQRQIDNRVDH